ncbi:MAG: hypothetical protein M3119_09320 [Verrucomicrobiota bacterium]|nr:hypothetical protein [Verrucomicrobiota bacterium]MDQ6940341.1 hypothetical protein [Verrucomicrobiota bacterium]
MPFPTELTKDCLGIVHAASGIVTGNELVEASLAATRLVQNTENFQYEFSDFTDATELRVESSHLEKIAATDHEAARVRPNAIIVVVAPQDFAYKMAQQWQEKVSDLNWTIHISRERTEAVRWLREHIKTERPELLAQRNESAA